MLSDKLFALGLSFFGKVNENYDTSGNSFDMEFRLNGKHRVEEWMSSRFRMIASSKQKTCNNLLIKFHCVMYLRC